MVGEDETAELRALRERAYGPDADIHDDPEALARLEELEAAAAPGWAERGTSMIAEPPQEVDAATPQPEDEQPRDDLAEILEGLSSEPASTAPPGIGVRLWRWMPVLWVASVLVAVGVAVAATAGWAWAMFAPIARAPEGVRQFAVLTEQARPAPQKTNFFGELAIRSFGDFHGLTVFSPDISSWQPGTGDCVFVMGTTDFESNSDSIEGPMFNGCAAGDFPAVAQIVVTKDLPGTIRELFAEGTGIQFVLDGSRVGVFVDR
ncbi:hypothetical protein [Microbacterium candidum]|uniref:Uncharacterized protein n=1 Tax=Microbacterium candidum TaxID=3041922 RepID=A0ABT7MZ17_9MICO|nr:hypothetical protein [Microbacterium sp. ASV49]MDL9979691.1 hypothetical protein [Microbacterium sp. ASV49]